MSRVHQLAGRVGGYTKWANTSDRAAATSPARKAFLDRFEREVDPEGKLPSGLRAERAEAARRAYFARLSLARWKSRKRKATS